MHRRKFLGTLAVGLGATALPVWLSRSFGLRGETCPDTLEPTPAPTPEPVDPPRAPTCGTGVATKPLLILVIPAEDRGAQYERGHAFGELLNHGTDEQRGLFALFDVACRRVDQFTDDLRTVVRGEPLMIVVDPHAAVPVRPLHAELPAFPDHRRLFGEDTPGEENPEVGETRRIRERIAVVADLLGSAAAHDILAVQAAREQAALSCHEAAVFADLPDSLPSLTSEIVDRAPALTVLAARGADEDTRARLWALLAVAVHLRLTNRPIDGAPWARGGGCGIRIEGDDSPSMMACGMGHVPALSSRFLHFYTERH
jgi:hypothetical protein